MKIKIHDGDWPIFVKERKKKKKETEKKKKAIESGNVVDYGGANQGFEDTRVYMYKRQGSLANSFECVCPASTKSAIVLSVWQRQWHALTFVQL